MAPQAALGNEASADARVQVAIRILEEALVKYGSHTAKGKGLLKMIQAGARAFGRTEERAQAILPAELKSALLDNAGAPAPGGPPPGGGPAGAPMAPGGLPPGGAPAA